MNEIEKKIAQQMGVETFSEANKTGDWEKVDPEILKTYREYAASCIAETMRLMDSDSPSCEIIAKLCEASDPKLAFHTIE